MKITSSSLSIKSSWAFQQRLAKMKPNVNYCAFQCGRVGIGPFPGLLCPVLQNGLWSYLIAYYSPEWLWVRIPAFPNIFLPFKGHKNFFIHSTLNIRAKTSHGFSMSQIWSGIYLPIWPTVLLKVKERLTIEFLL